MIKISKKRLKELRDIKDEDIDTSDIPEFGEEFWAKAVVEFPVKKKRVTIRLDDYILDWFQNLGRDKKGYQSKINAVLKTYVDAHKGSE